MGTMLALEPANQAVVKKSLYFAYGMAGLSGIIGVAKRVTDIFPPDVLGRFPQHEMFLYGAFAIALISALLLTFEPKVITVSFAQVGALTGLLWIGYVLVGVFIGDLLPVFYAWMLVGILILVLLFSRSMVFYYRNGSYADLLLGMIFIGLAAFSCSYPLYLLAAHKLAA
jgi:hypothetical protein